MTRERAWTLALVGGLCTLFVAKQIQFLDDPYHWDSLYYVASSARDIYLHPGRIVPQGPWDNGHPPLIFWALAAAWWAAGPGLLVSHLLILASALGAVLLVFSLGRSLFGARAGLIGAILLVVNPIFFYDAGTITVDLPLTAFTLLALVAALRRRWALATAAGCAMVLTRESALLFLPALAGAAWLLPERERRPSLAGPALMILVPSLALAAWYAAHYEVTGWWIYTDESRKVKIGYGALLQSLPWKLYQRTLRPFLKGFGQGIATLVTVGALALDLAARRRRPISREAWLLTGAAVAMLLPVGLATALMSIFLPRYLLPILPLFCVVAGWAIARTGRAMPLVAVVVIVPLLLASDGSFRQGWESNRSFLDFIGATQRSAEWIQKTRPDARVLADWPLWESICDPIYGYVKRPQKVLILGSRGQFGAYCAPGVLEYVPHARLDSYSADEFDLLWLMSPRALIDGRYADLARRVHLRFVKRVTVGSRSFFFFEPVRGAPAHSPPAEGPAPAGAAGGDAGAGYMMSVR